MDIKVRVEEMLTGEVAKITAQIIIEEATIQAYEGTKLMIEDPEQIKQLETEIKNLSAKIAVNKRRVEVIKTKNVEYAEKNYSF